MSKILGTEHRVMVTGGSGFIGAHLIDSLLAKGCEVVCLDRQANWRDERKGVLHEQSDIQDADAVDAAIRLTRPTSIVNLAGLLGTSETIDTLRDSVRVNILGGMNVLEAAVRHGIPAVQIAVGNYTWLNSYAITKFAIERVALMLNAEQDGRIAVVRGLNVYGPGQKHQPIRKVMPTFIVQALNNRPIEIYGDGEQLLDLIHVEDMAEILARAALAGDIPRDGVYEAGTGVPVTVNWLAWTIKTLCDSDSEIVHLPMRRGEPIRSITVGSPATLAPLGKLVFTPLADGLEKTVAWYREFYPWRD